MTTESIFSVSAPQIKALDRNLSAFSTLFAPGKSWDNVGSTAAPFTESRLTHSVANERVGFPVVEQPGKHNYLHIKRTQVFKISYGEGAKKIKSCREKFTRYQKFGIIRKYVRV